MTTEERLKELITSRYRSLREFAQIIDMTPSTLDSMLKRGLDRATIGNIIKVCNELHISIDELANGRIVSTVMIQRADEKDVIHILQRLRGDILTRDDLTLDGHPLTDMERMIMVNLIDAMINHNYDTTTTSELYAAINDRIAQNTDKSET